MTTAASTSLPALPSPESPKARLSGLDFCLYVFLLVWCVSPPLDYSLYCRLGALAAIMLLAVRVIFKAAASKEDRWMLIAFPLLLGIVTGVSVFFNFFPSQLNMLIFLSMSVCAWNTYFTPPSPTQRRLFLFITFAICLVWIYCTHSVIRVIPHVMRLLVKNSEESLYYASMGAGGYGFLYTLILMFPVGLGVIAKGDEPVSLRILALVFCVYMGMLASKSGYFLAFLLLLFSIFFFIVNHFAKNRVIILGFLLVFAIIVFCFADDILEFLMRKTDIPSVQRKLQDIQQMLNSDMDVGDSEFSTRSERYTRDLKLILSSPFWGNLHWDAVGKHSHLLDFAAIFGLPMAFFYVVFYWRTLKKFIHEHDAVIITCLSSALIMLFLNSITYRFGCALFILLPMFASRTGDKAEADEQKTGEIAPGTKGPEPCSDAATR